MRYRIAIGLGLMMSAVASTSAQTVVYVDMDATGATHDGTSWCQAYLTLDDALATTVTDTIIRVADGTYLPSVQSTPGTPRTETFQLIDGVTLEGGYAGCGADDPDERDVATYETVLSGDIGTTELNADNSYHVVTGSGTDATAVLDGFTITAGNDDRSWPNGNGGGMINTNGSPTLIDCTFSNNAASSNGGGMANYTRSSPTLTNCTFRGNVASYNGGGMLNYDNSSPKLTHCTFVGNSIDDDDFNRNGGGMANSRDSNPTLIDCIFSGNSSSNGGGMYNNGSSPTLTNCTFTGNSATTYYGGGMYNDNRSSPTVTNCTFTGNSATDGGGIANLWNSSPSVTNCVFIENIANGGGMFNAFSDTRPMLTNCTFIGNSVYPRDGGGMFNAGGTAPTLIRCTFSGNSAHNGGGMINTSRARPRLINCSFNGNSAQFLGGGMYNTDLILGHPTLINCVLIANSTNGFGGGMANADLYTNPRLINCTIIGNSSSGRYGGGGIGSFRNSSPSLVNCIVWGNMATIGAQLLDDDPGGVTTATYSNIEGGWPGTGNIDADPLLDVNLGLAIGSPCIDAGDNTAVPADVSDIDGDGDLTEPTPLDLAGLPRRFDDLNTPDTGIGSPPVVDMGAYEYGSDCNSNGLDDRADILGGTSTDCDEDTVPDECTPGGTVDSNGNGIPDLCDIVIGTSWDCNSNGLDDRADILGGTSTDCDEDTVPDECTPGGTVDCNGNGIPDLCDIVAGTSWDCNFSGIPDECEDLPLGVIFVDDDAIGGLNNGASWADAYIELANALLYASCVDIYEIRVAGGMYKPSTQSDPGVSRTETFALLDGVAIRGGYRGLAGGGNSDDRDIVAFPAILSGDIGSTGVASDNSYHVVTGSGTDATAVLDGVTIMSGNDDRSNGYGGGMLNNSGSPTVTNCTFFLNSTRWRGGGMFNSNGSPTVTNCTFSENSAIRGGGMYNDSSEPIVADCTFSKNSSNGDTAGGSGGGIHNDQSSPTLTNCIFTQNLSSRFGGGVYNDRSSPTLTNCAFSANTAYLTGGGMYNKSSGPTLTNNIFSDNSVLNRGGGVSNETSTPTLTNCTFIGNSARSFGGGMWNDNSSNATLANSIVWGNTAAIGPQVHDEPGGVTTATYSNIEGGWPGTGNIDADPLLDVNLGLAIGSPCIDAGDNTAVPADVSDIDGDGDVTEPTPLDLAGMPRFYDDMATPDTGVGNAPVVDMGAYEYGTDCNRNGVLDEIDIAGGTSLDCNTNSVPDECERDCDSDGVIDACELCGDLDDDGDVDADDYVLFRAALRSRVGDEQFDLCADYDNNGAVGILDYPVWLECYRGFVGDPAADPPGQPVIERTSIRNGNVSPPRRRPPSRR